MCNERLKRLDEEIARLDAEIAKIDPKEMGDQNKTYLQLVTARKVLEGIRTEATSTVAGVKKDLIVTGVVGAAEIAALHWIQDHSFIPKNLLSFIPVLKIKI